MKESPADLAVRRTFANRGAWIGAAAGLALSLLLRVAKGETPHLLAKSAMVVVIIAGLGAFVGVLVDAWRRSRRA